MEVLAKSRYIRTSARKLRLLVPLAKGLPPEKAIFALENSAKRAAEPLVKTIKQAMANAVNNLNLKKENLMIKNILIEGGPSYKRGRAGARGRVMPILKRTSHIRVILEAKEEKKEEKTERSNHGSKS
jgi:large subunit ribosomal protein L22